MDSIPTSTRKRPSSVGATPTRTRSLRERTKSYTEADWQKLKDEQAAIYADALAAREAGVRPDEPRAMDVAERHRLSIDRWFYPCSRKCTAVSRISGKPIAATPTTSTSTAPVSRSISPRPCAPTRSARRRELLGRARRVARIARRRTMSRVRARAGGEHTQVGTRSATVRNASAIGVFDSGVGGLSVLKHIRAQLPSVPLLYVADSGHVPYGDKTPDYIRERSLALTQFLRTARCRGRRSRVQHGDGGRGRDATRAFRRSDRRDGARRQAGRQRDAQPASSACSRRSARSRVRASPRCSSSTPATSRS